MKKNRIQDRVKHEEEYISFLEKRLASSNFKSNVSAEEYAKTETKLKKSKLLLKFFKNVN